MSINMKKINMFMFILSFSFILSHFTTYGAENIIGKVLSTDIVAYIDGLPIESYNIDGNTGIVAEDLLKYGYGVYYNWDLRCLEIENSNSYYDNIKVDYVPEKNTKPIGSFVSNVYSSDIKTFLYGLEEDKEIPSYNIGGKTIILIDSLEQYGDVIWYPDERKICFDFVEGWAVDFEDDYKKDTSSYISNFTIELTKNELGEFDITGENKQYLPYIKFGWGKINGFWLRFLIYPTEQTEELRNNILNNMLGEDEQRRYINKSCDFANEHIKAYINDEKVDIVAVKGYPKDPNAGGYYLYFDKEIRSIEDIETIKVECK